MSKRNLAGILLVDIESAELWETDMSLTGKLKMIFGGKIRPDEEPSTYESMSE